MKGKAFVQSAAGGTAESAAFLQDAVRSGGQPASPRTAPASGPAPGRGWGARGAGEDSSPPSFLGEPLPPPGLAAMSGQSITDRITAAQHSVTGSAVAKAVCKATTHEVMGPKKKHLDCKYGPPAAWGPGRAGLRGALAGVPGGLLGWAGLGCRSGFHVEGTSFIPPAEMGEPGALCPVGILCVGRMGARCCGIAAVSGSFGFGFSSLISFPFSAPLMGCSRS